MKLQNLTKSLSIAVCLLLMSCSQTASNTASPLSTPPDQNFNTPFFLQPPRTPGPFLSQATPSVTPVSQPDISDYSIDLPDRIRGAKVTWYYKFEFLPNNGQSNMTNFRNADGYVKVENSAFWRDFQDFHPTKIEDGQGVILRVKFDPSSEARVFFETITPENTYLRWGLFAGNEIRTDVLQDEFELWGGAWQGEIKIVPDHWYYLLLTIDHDTNFLGIIWDSENPEKQLLVEKNSSADWQNNIWDFNVRGRYGTMYIDEYFEIVLSDLE